MALQALRPWDPPRIGRFDIAARLGAGGMGVVYLGVDPAGRAAAVKIVREEYAADEDFRRRFDREVAAARAVDSPRVARVLEADPDCDLPWLATEYVHGRNLAHAVARNGALPVAELRALADGLAEALCAIHDAGVVHRDIKPGNVVLGQDGPTVVDFGIAAAGRTALTQTGVVLGSLGYMAPEQVTGEPRPGPAADVFSWGLTVAYAATARPPFGEGPAETVLFRTVYGRPDLGGLDDPLRRAVSRSVLREPDRRPTARDLRSGMAELGGPSTADLADTRRRFDTRRLVDTGRLVDTADLPPLDDLVHTSDLDTSNSAETVTDWAAIRTRARRALAMPHVRVRRASAAAAVVLVSGAVTASVALPGGPASPGVTTGQASAVAGTSTDAVSTDASELRQSDGGPGATRPAAPGTPASAVAGLGAAALTAPDSAGMLSPDRTVVGSGSEEPAGGSSSEFLATTVPTALTSPCPPGVAWGRPRQPACTDTADRGQQNDASDGTATDGGSSQGEGSGD